MKLNITAAPPNQAMQWTPQVACHFACLRKRRARLRSPLLDEGYQLHNSTPFLLEPSRAVNWNGWLDGAFLDGQGLKLRLAVRDRFSRNSFTMSLVPPALPPRLSYLTEI